MTDLRGDLPVLEHRTVSEYVAELAHGLLEQRRVSLGPPGADWAVVFGARCRYIVRCWPRGVSCTCPAGQQMNALCCHTAAALVAWAERDRLGVVIEFPVEAGDQLDLFGVVAGVAS
jgi:hypothetical protein